MTRVLLLMMLFFVSATLQVGVVHSLEAPLHLLPLHLLIGVIVLHRSGPEWGAAWFLASAVIIPHLGFDTIPWFGYVLVAATGVFLTTRLFTNRSVYALEGLAVVLFLVATTARFFVPAMRLTMNETLSSIVLLLLTTYVGFLIALLTEKGVKRYFFLKEPHATI